MIRLFVGIDLPEVARRRLAMLIGGVPGAVWVDNAMLHLTLRFIGEVDGGMARDIDQALDQAVSRWTRGEFPIVLAGVGIFETKGKPSALWAGVERSDTLLALRDKVEATLVRLGLQPEARRYTPHVTLARLKESPPARVRDYVAGNGLFRDGPHPVRAITLFSSHPSRSGALYMPEAVYKL